MSDTPDRGDAYGRATRLWLDFAQRYAALARPLRGGYMPTTVEASREVLRIAEFLSPPTEGEDDDRR